MQNLRADVIVLEGVVSLVSGKERALVVAARLHQGLH